MDLPRFSDSLEASAPANLPQELADHLPAAQAAAARNLEAVAEPEERLSIETIADRRKFFGVPCTFLVNGKCFIYAHRPLVCRTQVNLDSVDTLCQLVPGVDVPVPYLQAVELQGYFACLTHEEQYADIRELFPAT